MYRALLLAGAALLPTIASAQHAPETEQNDPFHYNPGADIVVTAPFHRDIGTSLVGVSVVTGTELTNALRPTIGDTLTRQPGVSATSFGPNASRPVLRGLQGDRVRVLTDGIGSFDVSTTSVDHAVAINPLTADRIEVLRGPSALLYGSSAIGGVVNVIDSRIPRRVPDEAVHVDAIATYGSAANERSVGGGVDAPIGSNFVVHVDGSYAKTDDLEIGGYVLSPALRAIARASDDPEAREAAALRGKLPNSASRIWNVAGGAALITDTGNLGISVSRLENRYGVPERLDFGADEHDHGDGEEGHAHEQVTLDMKQTRVDLRGEVETGGGFLDKIKVRAGYADYEHGEIEETGEVGTRFFSQGWEGRLELVQREVGSWKGAVGGQFLIRDFDVVGDEAFVPRNETQQYGVFTLQEFDAGGFHVEAGGRYERSILSATASAQIGNPDIRRTFDAVSGSLGASHALAEGVRIGINLSHSERAPSAEELFADGPHAGTQSFEVGNPDFAKEKSNGIEATLRARGDGYTFNASAYHSWFRDYIYQVQTGAEEDGLPVFAAAQADARYYGFEVEGSVTLLRAGRFDIVADGLADYVRARIVDDGPAPRIPPLRLLGGLEAQSDRLNARIEVEWTDDQKRVTTFETPTDGFTLVNASVAFKPFGSNNPTSIILSANNIFDVDARRHASFLKDFAPLAGRDVRVTARLAL